MKRFLDVTATIVWGAAVLSPVWGAVLLGVTQEGALAKIALVYGIVAGMLLVMWSGVRVGTRIGERADSKVRHHG